MGKHKPEEYLAIWHWNLRVMASTIPYVKMVQEKAAEMDAPLNVIYHRGNESDPQGWSTTDMIESPSSRNRMGLEPIYHECPGGCGSRKSRCCLCGRECEHGYATVCPKMGCLETDGRLRCGKCHLPVSLSRRGVVDGDGGFLPYDMVVQPWGESKLSEK